MSVTKDSSRSAANLTGRAKHPRQRRRRHFVGVDVHLDAERAADILADHAHIAFRHAEMNGEDVLHHVRRLVRHVDRQLVLGFVVVGEDDARFQGDAGMALETEGFLDHQRRLGERGVDVARFDGIIEGDVVAQIGMDHVRRRIGRGLGVGHRRQFFVGHIDQRRGVFGLGAAVRHHRGDRLALPAHMVDGDGVLRRRF